MLRQLFVLASCKPDRTADHGEFARPKRKRKRRGEPVDTLPDGVPSQAVASAFALLRQYTPHHGFAEAFLSALTAEVREVNGRGLRSRRSQSGDTEEDEREGDPLTSGVRLLIEGGGGSVWELLRILSAQSKASKGEWSWHLPSSSTRKKKRAREAARSVKPSSLSASTQTCWDALQRSIEDEWTSMDLDLDKIDEWRDALDRLQGYQSERCWRLIDLLVSAWHTQGRAAELSGVSRGQKRHRGAQSAFEDLHLVQQLRTRGSRLPLDDAGEALDMVFAGLCNLEAWADQPRRLHVSHESRLRRAEIAARLFLEVSEPGTQTRSLFSAGAGSDVFLCSSLQLARLSRIGALESSVLVRGIQERLVFASVSAWAAFVGVVQRDEHAASIIADVHMQTAIAAEGMGDNNGIRDYDMMLFPSQKELIFKALREGVASHSLSHYADSKRIQALETSIVELQAAQRLDLLLGGEPEAQVLRELSAITAKAANTLTPTEPATAQTPLQDGSPSTSARSEPQSAEVVEANRNHSHEFQRKSGRTVKAPVRTGLRKLPTHGMSRGKPPFRKERGEGGFSSSSASVSPSKDQAELRASVDRERRRGEQEQEEEEEGKAAPGGKAPGLDLEAWLFALATEELHALDGALSARRAMAAAAAAVEEH